MKKINGAKTKGSNRRRPRFKKGGPRQKGDFKNVQNLAFRLIFEFAGGGGGNYFRKAFRKVAQNVLKS